jgi:hypothetical protein
MGRRSQDPYDPAAAERRRQVNLTRDAEARERARVEGERPDSWGVDPGSLTLPANAEVAVGKDRRGRIVHACRTDVFELLHGRGGLADEELRAARRLEHDVGERAGLFRPEPSLVFVDSQGSSEGVTQRMVEAGRRVEGALAGLGPRQARLLRALIEPPMMQGRLVAWREVVERETGETHSHAQPAMVRAALADLALVYKAADAASRSR